MAKKPIIVSLWADEDRKTLLCSGLLLTGQYVLTVKHAFDGWSEDKPLYVRLIHGKDTSVKAKLIQRNTAFDAAILHLPTAVEPPEFPALCRRNNAVLDGKPAQLWVIDPVSHNFTHLTNYSIGGFDDGTGEYVISPDNAKGHSGGMVEVDGKLVGILSRRNIDDPLCRAAPIHLLWNWIQEVIGNDAIPEEKQALSSISSPSAGYLKLVGKVRGRIRERLAIEIMAPIAHNWGYDPLEHFGVGNMASGQLETLLFDLHRATQSSIGKDWKSSPPESIAKIKAECRFLLSELVKLAVNVDASEAELGSVATGQPEHIYLASQFVGTADVVYCALADLPHVLHMHEKNQDVVGNNAVHVDDLLPSGVEKDLRQEILRKLWIMAEMDEALPARLDEKQFQLLLSRIKRHRKRDGRCYLLAATGPIEWRDTGTYRTLADELRVGLVLRNEGECGYLLMEEPDLIDSVREYLQLLETF